MSELQQHNRQVVDEEECVDKADSVEHNVVVGFGALFEHPDAVEEPERESDDEDEEEHEGTEEVDAGHRRFWIAKEESPCGQQEDEELEAEADHLTEARRPAMPLPTPLDHRQARQHDHSDRREESDEAEAHGKSGAHRSSTVEAGHIITVAVLPEAAWSKTVGIAVVGSASVAGDSRGSVSPVLNSRVLRVGVTGATGEDLHLDLLPIHRHHVLLLGRCCGRRRRLGHQRMITGRLGEQPLWEESGGSGSDVGGQSGVLRCGEAGAGVEEGRAGSRGGDSSWLSGMAGHRGENSGRGASGLRRMTGNQSRRVRGDAWAVAGEARSLVRELWATRAITALAVPAANAFDIHQREAGAWSKSWVKKN